MAKEKILKATHSGPLEIGNIVIPCFVLEDGTRIISQRGIYGAIGRSASTGGIETKGTAHKLPRFLAPANLRDYIPNELIRASIPLLFKAGPRPGYGFRAEILPEICKVYLDARDAKVLTKTQQKFAQRCEALIRGFAGVGIIALVDEATGYQEVRARDELQIILKAYISPELLPWTRRFPSEFYRQMFRLWSWKYPPFSNTKGAPRGPRYAGKLTNELVYEKLPPGVLDELKVLNPSNEKYQRKARLHQRLTEGIGNNHLEKQVAVVTTLMKISPNKRTFKRHLERAFPKGPQQRDLFPELEEFPI